MAIIDITTKLPSTETVQDALPVRLPRGARATEVLGELEDPRKYAEGSGDVVLHLREESGAHIVQVTDSLGRLHRTDGPAVVRITPSGRTTRQWWVEARRIDDAEGPTVQLAQFTQNSSFAGPTLFDDEVEAMRRHLPSGFHVGPDGALRGPIGASGAITDADCPDLLITAVEGDPIAAVAEQIRRELVSRAFQSQQAARAAA